MLKFTLFLVLIVQTLSAPTNKDDHPAAAAVLTKPVSDDSHGKVIDEAKPQPNFYDKQYGAHVAKRDTNKPQQLPAHPADKPAPKPENVPSKSQSNHKHKRETAKTQTAPAPLNAKDTKPQILPATLEVKQPVHKSKRDTNQPQTLPAHLDHHHDSKPATLPAVAAPKTTPDEHKPKRDANEPAKIGEPKESHDGPKLYPAHSVPQISNLPAHNEPQISNIPAHDHQHKRENVPAKTGEPKESHDGAKLYPAHSVPQISNLPAHNEPQISNIPVHDHQHKRENVPSVHHDEKSKLDEHKANPKVVKVSDVKTTAHKDDHKRDIPVALTPSTSPKPENKEPEKSDHKTSAEHPRPLSSYSKPIPVSELFKHTQ